MAESHAHTHMPTMPTMPTMPATRDVIVTPLAQTKAREFIAEEEDPSDKVLRVGITSGGCSGFSYSVSTDVQEGGDQFQRYYGLTVVVDPKSLEFLAGATVDYVDEIGQAGFKFTNPKASSSCGCGTSFSV